LISLTVTYYPAKDGSCRFFHHRDTEVADPEPRSLNLYFIRAQEYKVKLKSIRPVLFGAGCLLILILLHQPLLTKAGDFLAPIGKGGAEVVILEGTATIRSGDVMEGVALLKNNHDSRLVVVLHLHEQVGQLFGIQEEYPQLLRKKLKNLGLKDEQIKLLSVPINDHPITLTEAKRVMAALAKEGVHSAFLISEGFHTRRSWAVYRQEAEPFKIAIIPHPCFIYYKKESWWWRKEGIRDFAQETAKLLYYLFLGYVSPQYVFKN
jgi:uncharacterized SAM-binding protein YcdF (DUF218 family)